MTKKEFLRCLWCKIGGLLKHRDRTPGQKELLHRAVRGGCYIPWGWGRCGNREVEKVLSYVKEDSQDTGGLAIVKLRLFFPLARH